MGGDEWAELSSADVLAYYQVWAEKMKRDNSRIESVLKFFDLSIAQNSYLTISPHLKKSSTAKVGDFRVFPDDESTIATAPNSEAKEWARQRHLELSLRAKARASEYFKKTKESRHGTAKGR